MQKMFTPSGRFQPDKKICFSMSDFHPGTVRFAQPFFKVIIAEPLLVESRLECRYDVSVILNVNEPASFFFSEPSM